MCPAVSLCASGTLEQEIDLPYCVNPTLTYRLSSPHQTAAIGSSWASERDHCFSVATLCWLLNLVFCWQSLHLVLTSVLDNSFETGCTKSGLNYWDFFFLSAGSVVLFFTFPDDIVTANTFIEWSIFTSKKAFFICVKKCI